MTDLVVCHVPVPWVTPQDCYCLQRNNPDAGTAESKPSKGSIIDRDGSFLPWSQSSSTATPTAVPAFWMMKIQCLLHNQNKCYYCFSHLYCCSWQLTSWLPYWIMQLPLLLFTFLLLISTVTTKGNKEWRKSTKSIYCISGDVLKSLSNQDIFSNHFLTNVGFGAQNIPHGKCKKNFKWMGNILDYILGLVSLPTLSSLTFQNTCTKQIQVT